MGLLRCGAVLARRSLGRPAWAAPTHALLQRRTLAAKSGYHEDAHMNELPCPCGPWSIWYDKQQSYFNKVLAFGVLWFFSSFGLAMYTGSIYLNFWPPETPAPPTLVDDEEDTGLPNAGLPPC